MDPILSIRMAELEDINTIGFLAQQIWPKAYGDIISPEQFDYMINQFYSPASLRQQMLEDRHQFLMVEQDEEPIGFASWAPLEQGTGIYKLHKLYVLPVNQGKGMGKAMIQFILENILEEGAKSLRLNVNRHNKARLFYEKMGFSVIGEEDIDIGNNYFMNDYVMELPVRDN
ncbi:GNAT family N-acetyltransferase [Flavitalea flava]